jgi:membrane carboxypeptidase/penicillin-binding protein PbpC
MTITAIREKLQDYIKTADDKKIKAIFTLVENDMQKEVEWWENKEFVAELNERAKRFEDGIDKGFTFEEVKEELIKRKSINSERI